MINFKQMLWLDVQMTLLSIFAAPMEGSMVWKQENAENQHGLIKIRSL